ncbi:MAG: hypothetical protein JJE55_08230 [Flavobacteriaceae bacterium]|nr:hypothetical protein [Flavobacteriaceae bacterium]
MKELLISPVFQILSIIVTGAVAWFFGGKATKNRELKSSDLDNEIKSATYYKGLLDDMAQRLDKAINELMQLETRVLELMKTNRELIDKNNILLEELQKFKQLNGKK